MKLLRALSYKLDSLLLALTLVHGVPAANGGSTVHGAVTTLGPDDLPVYLTGAQVLLRCEKSIHKLNTTVTDEYGRFSILKLQTDECSATASAEGFRSETKIAAATEGSEAELSFQLELLTVAERRDRP